MDAEIFITIGLLLVSILVYGVVFKINFYLACAVLFVHIARLVVAYFMGESNVFYYGIILLIPGLILGWMGYRREFTES